MHQFVPIWPTSSRWNSIISDCFPCEHCPCVTPSGKLLLDDRILIARAFERGSYYFFLFHSGLFRAFKARQRNEFRARPPFLLPPRTKLNRPRRTMRVYLISADRMYNGNNNTPPRRVSQETQECEWRGNNEGASLRRRKLHRRFPI